MENYIGKIAVTKGLTDRIMITGQTENGVLIGSMLYTWEKLKKLFDIEENENLYKKKFIILNTGVRIGTDSISMYLPMDETDSGKYLIRYVLNFQHHITKEYFESQEKRDERLNEIDNLLLKEETL